MRPIDAGRVTPTLPTLPHARVSAAAAAEISLPRESAREATVASSNTLAAAERAKPVRKSAARQGLGPRPRASKAKDREILECILESVLPGAGRT
ncbi:hypothetical protein THAOC_37037, partial [Thalassiosira oceanica]